MINKHIFKGFTLLELIIAVAIAGILMSLAIPNFSQFIQNNRLTSQVNEFITGINQTRQIAITEGAQAVMCHTALPNDATPQCGEGTSSSWNTGFIIYSKDPDTPTGMSPADLDYDPVNDQILQQIILHNLSSITVSPNTQTTDHIAFNSLGLTFNGGGNALGMTICDQRTGDFGSTIAISPSGRISRTTATCP